MIQLITLAEKHLYKLQSQHNEHVTHTRTYNCYLFFCIIKTTLIRMCAIFIVAIVAHTESSLIYVYTFWEKL